MPASRMTTSQMFKVSVITTFSSLTTMNTLALSSRRNRAKGIFARASKRSIPAVSENNAWYFISPNRINEICDLKPMITAERIMLVPRIIQKAVEKDRILSLESSEENRKKAGSSPYW